MSEETQLLVASDYGKQAAVPQLATNSPQVVYLDFDGSETSYYNRDLDVSIDKITVNDSGFGSADISYIVDSLNSQFGDDVVFTAELPTAGKFSTIYVGDTSAFEEYGSFSGIAETIDAGNAIHDDNAFVLLNANSSVELVASVISHETEHIIYGMEHGGEGLEKYQAVEIKPQTAITIKVGDITMRYGDDDQVPTYTYEGELADGHTLSVTLAWNVEDKYITDSGHIMAGVYEDAVSVVATVTDQYGNDVTEGYAFDYDLGDLVVDQRNITVTLESMEMTYGDEMPDLEGHYTFAPDALADGDLIDVTLGYDISASLLSSSGNVITGLHAGAIVEVEHVISNAENYNYRINFSSLYVLPKEINVSFVINDKVYDGTTIASRDTGTGFILSEDIFEGDNVGIFDPYVIYAFEDKNVGNDKTVTVSGDFIVAGSDAYNYDFIFDDTALANITPLAIEIGFTANDKVYDGNTNATREQLFMDQILDGDAVVFDDTGMEYAFESKNAGTGKTVTATGFDAETMLSGNDLQNYDITFVDTAEADIVPLSISIGFTANDKVYDGNTDATRDQLIMDEVLFGDDIAFDDTGMEYAFEDKNSDRNKTVTATGFDAATMLSGNDLQNYDIAFDDTAFADIVPLAVTIGFTANDKEYDGTTDATRDELVMDEFISDDDVVFDDTGMEYHFNDANVGTDKTVTATGFNAATMLSGDDLKNYDITFVDTALADITGTSITIRVYDSHMTYGGNEASLGFRYNLEGNLNAGDYIVARYTMNPALDAYRTEAGNLNAGTYEDAVSISVEIMDSKGNDVTDTYNINTESGALIVDKRDLCITILTHTITYGDELSLLEEGGYVYDPNGLATGDKFSTTLKYNTDVIENENCLTGSGNLLSGLYTHAIIEDQVSLDNADNYRLAWNYGTLRVDPKEINVGYAIQNKVYDGNTVATRDTDAGFTLSEDIFEGDIVRFFDPDVEYTFEDKNVGEDKTVTATGDFFAVGRDALNYYFTFDDTSTATISPLAVTIGFTANDKEYDGTTDATRDELVMDGIIAGDDVIFDDTDMEYHFVDATIGEDKTVTATGFDAATMLSGDDLQNYDINFEDTAFADITATSLTVSVTDVSMTYGENIASLKFRYTYEGDLAKGHFISAKYTLNPYLEDYRSGSGNLMAGTYEDAIGISITIYDSDGNIITGNYNINYVAGDINVNQLAVRIGFTACDKVYDGNTDAMRDELDMYDIFEGDHVVFDDSGMEYTFEDKNVGTDKTVTATGFDAATMLSGDDLQNYDITFVDNAIADIAPLSVTIGFTANDKTYDGTTDATRDQLLMGEIFEGDDVVFDDTGMEYHFDNANVGTGKTVTATGFDAATMLSGDGLQNYEIVFLETTTADITSSSPITISVTDVSMTYGDDVNSIKFHYTYEGSLAKNHFISVKYTLSSSLDDYRTGSGNLMAGTYEDVIGISVRIFDNDGNIVTNNYNINCDSGNISVAQKAVTIGFTANDKTYDATTDATRDELVIDGIVEGDDIAFDDTGMEYHFADANVGTDKTVTATGFDVATMLSGEDLQNYDITFVDTTTATITAIPEPDDLFGDENGLSWSQPEVTSGYVVEYSQDNFATCITIETAAMGLDHYSIWEGTWQWRMRAALSTDWRVGNEFTITADDEGASVLQAIANEVKDVFFVEASGIWSSIYHARHVGVGSWGGTGETVELEGKNVVTDIFSGNDDASIMLMSDDANGDALFIDDIYSVFPEGLDAQARIANINEIRAGAGDDIVDLTSERFAYVGSGMTVKGGLGDDVVWANSGNNTLFGDAGNDRLVGADGNDVLVGGAGNDSLHGGGGEDVFAFGGAWGNDSVEQLADGKVTLWFDDGDESKWNAATLTYTDGDKSVQVSGVTADAVTLKFGDDGSEQYGKLLADGAFEEFSSEKIFENKNTRGMLA